MSVSRGICSLATKQRGQFEDEAENAKLSLIIDHEGECVCKTKRVFFLPRTEMTTSTKMFYKKNVIKGVLRIFGCGRSISAMTKECVFRQRRGSEEEKNKKQDGDERQDEGASDWTDYQEY